MYINGLVGAQQDSIVSEEDISKAFDLFKSAADQNDPDGQYFVGRMYEDGLAPSQDIEEAIRYYGLAAEQDQIYAQVAYDRITTKSDGPVSTSFINNKLLGNHLFSLQWISWDRFGNVTITKTNNKDEFYIEGVQDGKLCADEEEGKNNEDYVYINGVIKVINEKKLKFFGTISTKVYHLNNGEVCSRYGSFTFEATGNRKYWRLQEMDNPCDGVTDYVDIYFN